MEASDSPPPAKRTRRFASPLEASEAAGSYNYVIVIDNFLAYIMNIRRGYYTRVGDFDPPTLQPTNTCM